MRIGFIGVGGIANNYLGSLKRLGRSVAAVADINAQRAAEAAVPLGAASYPDHRSMLEREKLDAVFIAIPPGAQDTQAADAARAGAAVFVAKPVALSLETARHTREAIEKSGVINQAGYMARYSDITEKARDILAGRPLAMGLGRFMCRMGANHPWWGKKAISGGQITEQSTHVFDLLRYFLGEPVEAHSFGHSGLGSDIADFEDSTVCSIRFASGAVANVASTNCASVPDGFALELSGRDAYLKLVMDTTLRGVVDKNPLEFKGEETGYFRQVELFLAAAENRDQSLVRSSYADAARTLALTLAATRALETSGVEQVEAV